MNKYGKCNYCGKPFNYGDTTFRLQVIQKSQSQGMPDEFTKDTNEYHSGCMPAVTAMWPRVKNEN